MRAERLVFAGAGTAAPGDMARFLDDGLNSGDGLCYRHFRAPDGRRFELLDRLP
ncbi:MAG: hypothetical protein ABIR67_08345 [Gaiellaceae bacterium]